ncbi:MAG: hypothetical protein SF172_16395 [Burkholderiales bacterium]|nr:hypothetical protein [Burkholderiales bacterium]
MSVRMGPEPLIFPLAFIGLFGSLVALMFIARARGRSWLAVPLVAGIVFSALAARGGDNFGHTVTFFLMFMGIFTLASVVVLSFAAILFLPFKPQLVKLARRLGFLR